MTDMDIAAPALPADPFRIVGPAVVSFTGGRGARFRKDWKGGYAAIGAQARAQPALPSPTPGDDGADIFAACDVGCGV